jgi:hypothetical protein
MSQTVTNNTSIVLVPTATTNSYIVYLPELLNIGQIITIRDNDGNASATNQIYISTTSGIRFSDRSSLISITNPYGYVIVFVNPDLNYSILNTYGFTPTSSIISVESVNLNEAKYIDQLTQLTVNTFISSSLFYVNGERVGDITNIQLQSTVTNLGSLGYISTIPQIIPVSTMFLTGGNLGNNIQYTTDETTWTGVTSVFSQHIFNQGNAILYANDMFVAVGQDTSPRANIQWSLDGQNWNYSTSPATTDIKRQVSFANGIWHVVGETSVYSRDGRIWNTFSNPLSNSYGITYGKGMWVAAGQGVMPLAWSKDGSNWSTTPSPSTITTVYTSSISILCPPWPFTIPPVPLPPSPCDPCKKPRQQIQRPPKLIFQSTIVSSFTSSFVMAYDVAYDGSRFLAVVSTMNQVYPNILYSTDGSNWAYSNVVGSSSNWRYIYGNGQLWMATGCNSMSYSVNGGSNWTVTPYFVGSNFSFTRPYWNGTKWWVGETSGSIWSSSNGLAWSQNNNFTGTVYGFTYIPPITGGAYVIPSTVQGIGSLGYISTLEYESTFASIVFTSNVQTNSTIYSYKGYDQTFIVPGNISSLEFYMWGAGGGGASGGTDITLSGGGAAFLSGILKVDPFDAITVVVGQGGLPGFQGGNTTMYGNGGGAANTTRFSGGAGGGRSAIFLNGIEIVTAGGGGGQGVRNDTNYAGGGAAFGNGTQSKQGYSNGGTGGSSTTPGIGAINALTNTNAQNGYYLTGGYALEYGGGGGGGYFGGGGGAVALSNTTLKTGNGGGGGGSYYNSDKVLSLITGNGSGGTPGNTTNIYYTTGIGKGGTRSNAGGNGLVVFSYTTITTKPQVSSEGNFTSLYVEDLTTNTIEVRQPQTSLYVAVGSGTNSIQYSGDGKNWLNGNNTFNQNKGYKVSWNGSYWLAAGQDNSNGSIKYSQDGITWINAAISIYQASTLNIKWNGQMWLALGTRGNNSNYSTINYSYDGFSWLKANSAINTYVNAAAWNGNMWVAVGYDTSRSSIAYSYDGINWSKNGITNNFIGIGTSVGWNGRLWVATATSTNTSTIKYSHNGLNWSDIVQGGFTDNVKKVEWNGQYWLANGSVSTSTRYISSMIQVSSDGSNWSSTLNGTNFTKNQPSSLVTDIFWDGIKWFITSTDPGTSSIKNSGKDQSGSFTWINTESGGFSGGGQGIAYNTPQLPYLQNSNFALYQRTNTQPLYDTPSNNFIKTTETLLDINNAIYVGNPSTNVTYFNSKVGIFQPNPSYNLHLARDSAFKPGSSTWAITSDCRIKENIQEANLEICASTIMALPLRTYSYTSSFTNLTGISQEERYGFIAQEVKPLVKNTVEIKPGYGHEDFHYLNTDQIHYIHMATTQYLIEKMSTQQSTIDGLLTEI